MTSPDSGVMRLARPIRVLLVEDDPGLREVLADVLGSAEMEVVQAEDGVEALAELDGGSPEIDVVVSDRRMPRLDGLELLRWVKGRRELALLPVILLTVAAEPRQVVEGLDAGAYAYVSKPADAAVLISMIRSAAADWRHVQELNRHIRSDADTLVLARSARFEYVSPEQAMGVGTLLAKTCPDPDRVVTGLCELLVNAVEHGNLEIGYDEKGRLLESRTWRAEIERRLADPRYAGRKASVAVERGGGVVVFTIRDEGRGFEPGPFLEIDPSRVFDAHGRGIAMARLLSFDELRYSDGGRCAIAVVREDDGPR